MHYPTDMIAHTTAVVILVVEHCLERKINVCVCGRCVGFNALSFSSKCASKLNYDVIILIMVVFS